MMFFSHRELHVMPHPTIDFDNHSKLPSGKYNTQADGLQNVPDAKYCKVPGVSTGRVKIRGWGRMGSRNP